MNSVHSEMTTLSSSASLTPIVEKKIASGLRLEIESGVLMSRTVMRLAKTPEALQYGQDLAYRADFAMALFKMVHLIDG